MLSGLQYIYYTNSILTVTYSTYLLTKYLVSTLLTYSIFTNHNWLFGFRIQIYPN